MVKIEVTEEDIRVGEPQTCKGCPVALATERHLKGEYRASIGNPTFSIKRRYPLEIMHLGVLPKEAQEFIRKFDTYEDVKPFSFELDLPKELLNGQD